MNHAEILKKLLSEAVQQNASDLHISVDRYPTLRVAGVLIPLDSEEVITEASAQGLISELFTDGQKEKFLKDRQLDFAYSFTDNVRFRVSTYFQQGFWAASLRMVPAKVPTIEELGLPSILHDFAKLTQGLILMVGPAGHGKSTTTAAILDEISHTRAAHIITVEDPIEYLFEQSKGIVSQREVGSDVTSFAEGLRTILREDPDVIMVGEMRDADSIATAMTAAETGHLVLSTLHTNSASQTVDRIIDSFPSEQQPQIVAQVATTLVAIVSERLVPAIKGGRVPALEIMVMNPAIRNLIREKKIFSIDSVIQTGTSEGMKTLNQSLAQLVKDGVITAENAELFSTNTEELKQML
ncbi:MAG: PilT/PilU family type 4a pilus ATPase [Candidatus Yanofskybacteria bacterium]|nr:PilT/PilU family type 4a pilus ATPase [Candidatus Yanofskybacteria bacterium]